MKNRVFFYFCIVSMFLVPISSFCQTKSNTTKSELVVAISREITSMTPYMPGLGTLGANLANQIHDCLIQRAPDGSIEPALVESWSILDDTTWQLRLRKGVTFHNGEVFNADAIIFTWNFITTPGTPLTNSADLTEYIKSIEKKDDYTILIHTKVPYSGLLLRLAAFRAFPPQYMKEHGLAYFNEHPIGTGPFKFVSRVVDEKTAFEAYEKYWGGSPKIKKLTFVPIVEQSTRVAALEAGDIDIINGVPTSQVTRLKSKGLAIISAKTTRSCYIGFNTIASKPLKDIRVRYALNHAVNVDEIINVILGGYAFKLADCTFNPTYTGYRTDLQHLEFNPDKAKKLLAEAGYPNGLNLTMSYVPGQILNDTEVAQVVVAQLSKVGINVSLSEVETGVKNKQLLDDSIADLYIASLGGPQADGDLMNSVGFDTKGRYSTWANAELDALRAKANAAMNPVVAKKLWGELQEKMWRDAPGIAMYQAFEIYAYNPKLKNWLPKADDLGDYSKCYF